LFIFAPLFFLLVFISILSGSALGGLNFSIKAMMPKASKLNPMNGLKRMFGIQSIINLFKSLLKFILVAGTMYLVLRMEYSELLTLSQMSLEPALAKAGAIIIRSALLVALTLLIIAAIDIPIQIYQFTEGMKMTLQEVKDEMKDVEGRPEVKQKIKQRQREIATSQMMDKVKDADVVITNPEHFSVALSYDPVSDGAPIVLAKGADLMAFRIREEAQKHGIQIFSAPPLARALFFTTEIDQPVHPDLYYAVAQVIAYVFNLNSLSSGGLHPQKPQPNIPSSMEFDENGNTV
jgi:flagellar biosynthetic protein FlhB